MDDDAETAQLRAAHRAAALEQRKAELTALKVQRRDLARQLADKGHDARKIVAHTGLRHLDAHIAATELAVGQLTEHTATTRRAVAAIKNA